MLDRFVTPTLAVGLMLFGGGRLSAQEAAPGPVQSALYEAAPAGAVQQQDQLGSGLVPVKHCTSCNFDPYEHFDDTRAGANKPTMGSMIRDHRYFNARAADGDYCDFQCANCYSSWDIEKRIFFSYSPDGPQGHATQFAYNNAHSGQVGVELLPWVMTDSPNGYTRWGGTFMFNYSNYDGFKSGNLQSRLSGRELRTNDGVSYQFILGPTIRHDIEIFGLRVSPNATVGMIFDWSTLKGIEPSDTTPRLRRVDEFKFSGFGYGGYARAMLDFPIGDYIMLGVGAEYKFVSTDVLMNDDDLRKHMGVVIAVSFAF
jgi:hypothetical protein